MENLVSTLTTCIHIVYRKLERPLKGLPVSMAGRHLDGALLNEMEA
jgi:hypothetical protein